MSERCVATLVLLTGEKQPEASAMFPPSAAQSRRTHGMLTTHADVISPDLLAFVKG